MKFNFSTTLGPSDDYKKWDGYVRILAPKADNNEEINALRKYLHQRGIQFKEEDTTNDVPHRILITAQDFIKLYDSKPFPLESLYGDPNSFHERHEMEQIRHRANPLQKDVSAGSGASATSNMSDTVRKATMDYKTGNHTFTNKSGPNQPAHWKGQGGWLSNSSAAYNTAKDTEFDRTAIRGHSEADRASNYSYSKPSALTTRPTADSLRDKNSFTFEMSYTKYPTHIQQQEPWDGYVRILAPENDSNNKINTLKQYLSKQGVQLKEAITNKSPLAIEIKALDFINLYDSKVFPLESQSYLEQGEHELKRIRIAAYRDQKKTSPDKALEILNRHNQSTFTNERTTGGRY